MEVRNISIKSARAAKGLTQKELADKIHVDQSAIALWESGKTGPKRNRLLEVANVLECSVEELLKED